MTVRSILDTKGHQILSVEPDAKLSAAVKILGERKIGWFDFHRADDLIAHGVRAAERAIESIQEAIHILAPPSAGEAGTAVEKAEKE